MVISMSKSIVLVVFLVAIVATNQATAQPPTTPMYFAEVCRSKMGNYTTNSTYEANLMTLLTDLYGESFTAPFSNASVGSASSEQVFGQYYCRGDIDSSLCSDCIKEAAQTIFVNCHNFKTAVVWYQECTLRYGNVSMVGIVAEQPRIRTYSDGNVTDPGKVAPVVNMTMARLINESAYGNPSSYATGEVVVSRFETAYCLVQCSPDINGTQCDTCLHSAYDYVPDWWPQTWTVFNPSCQLRYSTLGAFYGQPQNAPPPEATAPTSVTPTSPSLTPPTPVTTVSPPTGDTSRLRSRDSLNLGLVISSLVLAFVRFG